MSLAISSSVDITRSTMLTLQGPHYIILINFCNEWHACAFHILCVQEGFIEFYCEVNDMHFTKLLSLTQDPLTVGVHY